MNALFAVVAGYPVTVAEALVVAFGAPLLLALALTIALARSRGQKREIAEVEAQLQRDRAGERRVAGPARRAG